MAWTYDARRHRYTNTVTGEVLTFEELIGIRDGYTAARAEIAKAIVRRYLDGEIGIREWERLFRATTAQTFESLYLLGVGGSERAAQLSRAGQTIEALLLKQVPFADAFIQDVKSGRVTPDQMEERAAAYMGSAIESYEQGNADDFEIELPFFPGGGDTPCVFNCRCSWRVETSIDGYDEVTTATWETMSDDQVCSGCEARAAEWQNREVRRATLTADAQRSAGPSDTVTPYDGNSGRSADDLMRRAGFSEGAERIPVRCPVCGRMQMKFAAGSVGIVECKCDKCNELMVVDLAESVVMGASR